jgi:hypothetical protein
LGHRCLHSSCPMDFNKRRGTSSIAYWRISRSWIVLPHIFWIIEQPREARMSDLGSQPREVWKQPKARWFRKHKQAAVLSFFFIACFALFAHVPLVWHSEPIILNLKTSSLIGLLCLSRDRSYFNLRTIRPFDWLRKSDSTSFLGAKHRISTRHNF